MADYKHLFEYQGSSPCPSDIDKYWDDALAEMNSTDHKAEFIKKEFPSKIVDMYDLYYTGTKNAKIHAKVVIPKNREEKMPAVLLFHGYGDSAPDWSDLLRYASQNYVVAFMDVRGQGGFSEDVGGYKSSTLERHFSRGIDGDKHDLLMRDVFLDTSLLAKIIMGLDFVDETRVATSGGSQGGALAVVCACLVPEIKKCAIQFPYLSDYKKNYELGAAAGAFHSAFAHYFRHYDPLHEREDEFFEKLGYIDIQNIAKRMKADLLMFTGLLDVSVPAISQFAMYNKVTSNKKAYIYPDYGHEGMVGCMDIIFEFLSDL